MDGLCLRRWRRLRGAEDYVCRSVGGRPATVQKVVRLVCRARARGAALRFDELPGRLRKAVTAETYEQIVVGVREAAGDGPYIRYARERIIFDDEELERARRVRLYAAQVAQLQQRYGTAAAAHALLGPGAVPVRVKGRPDLPPYPSARAAAAAVGVRRSDIRNAIRFGNRCAGVFWEYVPRAERRLVTRTPRRTQLAGSAMTIGVGRLELAG